MALAAYPPRKACVNSSDVISDYFKLVTTVYIEKNVESATDDIGQPLKFVIALEVFHEYPKS